MNMWTDFLTAWETSLTQLGPSVNETDKYFALLKAIHSKWQALVHDQEHEKGKGNYRFSVKGFSSEKTGKKLHPFWNVLLLALWRF